MTNKSPVNPTRMTDPSPELQQRVSLSFAQQHPQRLFRGCKVAAVGEALVVRIYSHDAGFPNLIPTPYQIFRFDSDSGSLSPLSGEEAAPYTIPNYK
jgi:hypothetical protein